MSPPTVRVNTFVKDDMKPYVDPISKIFIISEVILGMGRLPLLKRRFIYLLFTFLIFIGWTVAIMTVALHNIDVHDVNFTLVIHLMQNIILVFLSYVLWKWLLRYYSELCRFDAAARCRPKYSAGSLRNLVQAALTCLAILLLFVVPRLVGVLPDTALHYIPTQLIGVIEVYYYGHLLNLLTPRLKLINYCIESSLSCMKSGSKRLVKDYEFFEDYKLKVSQFNMKNLMDLYEIVVESYDCLIESIKWQLLITIMSTFLTVLSFMYKIALNSIRTGEIIAKHALMPTGISIILMAPLFAPCTFGDSVHNEVKTLRELLASRLYENKLDKPGRSAARALLALTETRDLSFRLLRMLDIDISLPFKFVGLLVTYLIILLQFEKVINP